MSLLKTEMELLRRVPLFSEIDAGALRLLAYTSDPLTFEDGQTLFRMGDKGDAAYLIVTGEAEVSIPVAGDDDLPVARLSAGDIVGEIAMLCDVPRTATVRASGELQTLKIKKEPFIQLLRQYPEVALEMLRVLSERLHHTTAELVEARRS